MAAGRRDRFRVSLANQYDQANVETMELLYGPGYLSMGGDDEVARILKPVEVSNKAVLDVGCGMGGAAITLVRDHAAQPVIGIDLDAGLLARAAELIDQAGLQDQIELRRVEPGPLPFADAQFDLVYLTAVSCHIEDLVPFLVEIRRVIRPGGNLVGGEWFIQQENDAYHRWDTMLRQRGLNFYFVTQADFIDALEQAGFTAVEFHDQSMRTAGLAAGYLERSKAELCESLLQRMGDEGFAAHLEWTQIRADGLAQGGSGYGHFLATNPV